ncbi:MAG: threonylcarbamoyl-AMP synthase [Planctomycetia bacterium]|nr:threonylcarbamoyl-AMP synthase [Planctomycetia bacterium]
METVVLKVDPLNPDPDVIGRAAEVLRAGRLVAFPTETVYGLGANALDAEAVARIFDAKGRPATNPLIVHVSDVSEVLNVASVWPECAEKLSARFWPGPLTLVVPKRAELPEVVTAGGATVAVRCPAHAVARALIRASGIPLAAPSANRSSELSPTRAEHVLSGLNGRIDMILSGGPCSGGIESTVVDVTGKVPRVLRFGLITVPMLEEVCGKVEVGATAGVARSPGQLTKHYSPRTRIVLADSVVQVYIELLRLKREGKTSGVMVFSPLLGVDTPNWFRLMPTDAEAFAACLYQTLHECDCAGLDAVIVQLPPDTPEWSAIRDRLVRAAA